MQRSNTQATHRELSQNEASRFVLQALQRAANASSKKNYQVVLTQRIKKNYNKTLTQFIDDLNKIGLFLIIKNFNDSNRVKTRSNIVLYDKHGRIVKVNGIKVMTGSHLHKNPEKQKQRKSSKMDVIDALTISDDTITKNNSANITTNTHAMDEAENNIGQFFQEPEEIDSNNLGNFGDDMLEKMREHREFHERNPDLGDKDDSNTNCIRWLHKNGLGLFNDGNHTPQRELASSTNMEITNADDEAATYGIR